MPNVISLGLAYTQEVTSAKHREPAIGWADAPPIVGVWLAGDILYKPYPVPGSPTGFICIAPGFPGLWTTLPETVV